jgi:voltage-gated potassium channel Kch
MNASSEPSAPRGLWARVHHTLFDIDNTEGAAHTVDLAIGWVIILSVAAIWLEQNPIIARAWALELQLIDVVTVVIFSIEYLLRLGAAGADPRWAHSRFPRLRYALSPYALIDLVAIAPFYLAMFTALDLEALRALRLVRLMRVLKLGRHVFGAWHEFKAMNAGRPMRAQVYAALEVTGHSGRLRTYVDNFIVFWVLVSIASVILESVDAIGHTFAREFQLIDTVAFSIFTLEYLARWYAAPENPNYAKRWSPRMAFMRHGQSVVDLLAILPFLLERFLPWPLDLRFLRVFRLLRLLKLTRYTSATVTLYKVVRREGQVIFASVFVMLLLVVLTASIGYLFEHAAQPDKFDNIPQSIYWAVITLASVGYGDISPVTGMGRALTVVLSLLGIGIFAIPAGLLASAFTDQLRIDRENLKHKLLKAYDKGKLDPQAHEWLLAETERLHLTQDEVHRLLSEAREAAAAKDRVETQGGIRLIDPQQQPDLAAAQWRLLVQQLQLLQQASGHERLAEQLADSGDAPAQAVLTALSPAPQPPQAGP